MRGTTASIAPILSRDCIVISITIPLASSLPKRSGARVAMRKPCRARNINRRTKNTLLTPHIGYVSSEAYEKFFNGYFLAIDAFIRKNPRNIIL